MAVDCQLQPLFEGGPSLSRDFAAANDYIVMRRI
jgi:hypothetical protein